MTQSSAVEFATTSRIHVGLGVRSLERSLAFYRILFAQEPTKTRPGYAKFEVGEPSVNLSLIEVGGQTGPNNPVTHFGIQVKSTAAVASAAARLAEANRQTKVEEHASCCYAVQNKVWTIDPDGNKWEVYVVLDDDGAARSSSTEACCRETPAIIRAVGRGQVTAPNSSFEPAADVSTGPCLTDSIP